MSDVLPPLPEPDGVLVGSFARRAFSADQMRDYARAALAQRAEPLTDEQIYAIAKSCEGEHGTDMLAFARAILKCSAPPT